MQHSSSNYKPNSVSSDQSGNHDAPYFKNNSTQRTFTQIPTVRPDTPLLNAIDSPKDLKALSSSQLITLADELRAFMLYSVGLSGGHFGANLGVVELTIALHYLWDTPDDKLVWDVGHQAYAHKVLTGRRERLSSIRSKGGLTAFPERSESIYDTFGVGHSSTAISAGLGMSLALRHKGLDAHVVSVVGDGAMTGGMAFEAMNDAVQQHANLLVVLNDNDMSISCATGGFSRHLAMVWESGYQVDITANGKAKLIYRPDMPLGDRRSRHAKLRNIPKVADNLFRAIGFKYFGPFDGHNLHELLRVLDRAKNIQGPVLVHVYTTKGKGFMPAEDDPVGYHAIGKLPVPNPAVGINSVEKSINVKNDNNTKPTYLPLKYSQVFGEFICDKAKVDKDLIAITPAMEEGSGMSQFAREYSDRFFDVAIAEQHAVTLAGGMATQGVKPIVAIYSTFLQRGYDQLIHDVALQNLDVMFAIDRAGLVGADGATHAGVFDLAFMRCLPNMVIATPKDENECYHLLNTCYEYKGVSAVRYPRGAGTGSIITKPAQTYEVGRAMFEIVYEKTSGDAKTLDNDQTLDNDKTHVADKPSADLAITNARKLALLAFGPMVATAKQVAEKLNQQLNIEVSVVNMRWVKPLDTDMIDSLIGLGVTHIVTLEEHTVVGGAGSSVNEYLINSKHNLANIDIKNIGIPDRFIAHGSHEEQLQDCQLDVNGVQAQIQNWLSD